jgi:hypothetical protein
MADTMAWPADRSEIVRGLTSLPTVVSDELILRQLAAAFARVPLMPDETRDAKLVAFAMDIDSGRLTESDLSERPALPPVSSWIDGLSTLAGISKARVRSAIDRLVEAQVLVSVPDTGPGRLDFVEGVLGPSTTTQWISWPSVVQAIVGRPAPLLVLRAALDLLSVPWEWGRLTHEMVAEHACYSIGMAQKGLDQLVISGVLERSLRVGRGHDYRFSPWALGRTARPTGELPKAIEVLSDSREGKPELPPRAVVEGSRQAPSGPVIDVQVGGLILHVPLGTEVEMSVDQDGAAWYSIGPDLRVRARLG